jgi:opacity protein-like surface antigen
MEGKFMHRVIIYAVVILFIVVADVAIGMSEINSTNPEIQYKASGQLLSAFNKAMESTKSPTKSKLSKKKIKKPDASLKKKHKKTPKVSKVYAVSKSAKSNAKMLGRAIKLTKTPTKAKLSKEIIKKPCASPPKTHKVQQLMPSPSSKVYVVPKSTKISTDNLNQNTMKSIEKAGKKSAIGRPYFGIVAGIGLARIGGEQQSNKSIYDDEYNEYLPANNFYSDSAAVYGINGGYEFVGSSNGLLSLGMGVYQNSNYQGSGQVWQVLEFDGRDHTFDYEYKLQSIRFMLETQFAWQFDFEKIKLIPFVSLGAGPTLNFANSYKGIAVDSKAKTTSEFDSNRNTSFAYQLGAGIAYPFNADCDRLLVAYRYVDLGKAQFNTTGVVGSTYQLSVEKNRSNEIYIGYTHLFDF